MHIYSNHFQNPHCKQQGIRLLRHDKLDTENTILLSISNEIARIRSKEDMLHVILSTFKEYINFDDSMICRYNVSTRTCKPYIYHAKKERSGKPEFKGYLDIEYPVIDDSIDDSNNPMVYSISSMLPEGSEQITFMHNAGIKEFVVIKLIEGGQLIGLFVLLSERKNSFSQNDLQLLQKMSFLISTATANIIANEEIAKREEEKTTLLSLSKEISILKSRNDLFRIVNVSIKNLFTVQEFAIAQINEDGATYGAFMMDLEDKIKNDIDFADVTSNKYDINDPIFSRVINSEDPVIFHVNEIAGKPKMPAFVDFWKKVGLQLVLCNALRAGGKDIGMAVLHLDPAKPIDPKSILLKGVCAQLAVAISNILAGEEIARRERERELLLSLNMDIAAVRNNDELLKAINQRLKKLLGFTHTWIAIINDDKSTVSTFLLDPESKSKSHPTYREAKKAEYLTNDGVLDKAVSTPRPVFFDLQLLKTVQELPLYLKVNFESGIEQMAVIRFSNGDKVFGFWMLFFEKKIYPSLSKLSLIEGLAHQMSITVSNIIATQKIQQREDEKSKLLAFSNALASSKDKSVIGRIVTQQLKEIFRVKGYYMLYALSNDKKSYYPLLFDPDSSPSNLSPDPGFETMIRSNNLISDGIMKKILEMDRPILFNIEERFNKPMTPAYSKMMSDRGITKISGAPIKLGDESIGIILFDTNNVSLGVHEQLFKGICSQIAISVSNIIADDEIKGREKQKSLLLEFSNAIASVRDKNLLSSILNQQLKKLFGIKEYAIHILSEDKKTHRPVFYDPEAEFAKHPIFQRLVSQQTDIQDGVFDSILASEDPVTFDAESWVNLSSPPIYADAAFDISLKRLTGVRIHLGKENIAVLNFRHDGVNITPDQYPLLKSICSQIAIAISNIMANEKVLNQLNEINEYKRQLEEEKIYLKEELETTQNLTEMIGESHEMKKISRLISQVAHSDSTVLILGETGTGKELVARAIHNASPRANKLMVKVNCAALPVNLIESELFGHERGSFTGATERRIGKFELANNGTLFLDEIGEMPLELQVKLLRALQEKEIERIGGRTTIKVDARIIAATNRNLEKLMEEGKFRSDLYYRLNIFPINLPPLRNRREDIPSLASHFILRFAKKAGKEISTFSNKALQELIHYDWPGNIRELEHLIERSVLLTPGDMIKEIHLPSVKKNAAHLAMTEEVRIKTIDENEREHILKILKYVNGRISGGGGAAELLGIPPSTLNSRIKRLGIRREHFG